MAPLLYRFYRRLIPASLRRRFPQDAKYRISSMFGLLASRDLSTMRTLMTAWSAGRHGDLKKAVDQWQMVNTRFYPINFQLRNGALLRAGSPVGNTGIKTNDLEDLPEANLESALAEAEANLPPDIPRKLQYARAELAKARLELAMDMRTKGRKRAFSEYLCRAVEAIPDQRVLKKDRSVLNGVQHYVQDALRDDGVLPRPECTAHDPASNTMVTGVAPLRVAIVLDVLKLSDVHTHSRVVLAICRNLMRIHPQVQTHIIVTNERFTVTTPVVATSFDPQRKQDLIDLARRTFPDDFGKRFFIHIFGGQRLEGLVDTCKSILEINPDVLLYGGGSKGLFSNESRVVRHCLYDVFPTAFFFIQSNNEVDEKNDLIIARGPHVVLGAPKDAKIQIQPYPTITQDNLDTVVTPRAGPRKIIVSAITGVRMDIKMAQQSDSNMRTFLSILEKTPDAVWHFIGASNPQAVIDSNPQIARGVADGRIIVHPVLPMDEFTKLVVSASLFLHLPGFTGGSGGATVARRAGVPILTFRHSDVSGRQPAETIFDKGQANAFTAKAIQLLHDPDEWARTVRNQIAHTEWIKDTAAQGFYDCLVDAVKIGEKRLQRTPIKAQNSL